MPNTTYAYHTPTCVFCNQSGFITVPATIVPALIARAAGFGGLMQDIAAVLSPEDREQLISGTHPACWDTML
jgi:hypothetical protein